MVLELAGLLPISIDDLFYPLTSLDRGILSLPVTLHLSILPIHTVYLHEDLSMVSAKVTKWAPNMHIGIQSVIIGNVVDWLLSSRSFKLFQQGICVIKACLHDNQSHLSATISRYAPGMHLGTCLVTVKIEVDWPWPTMILYSLTIMFMLQIEGNRGVLHILMCTCYNITRQETF